MKIEYVCHACVVVDTGDLRIATDPWYVGPAYSGQWNVFPKPLNAASLDDADVILISHGHEDHLHEATLRTLPKSAKVFYPYNWYGGTREYIRGMGFNSVREAMSFKTYRLSAQTSVTFIAVGLDSIIVIEAAGKVLVNVNDALHAMPADIIDYYVTAILRKWPVVDIAMCGFGGASYFPNTLHLEGKDDIAIGQLREQLFAHNFCRIVRGLKPRVAVPFAADFALLSPHQRWINDVRFPRHLLGQYLREQFSDSDGIAVLDMYSGDVLENGSLVEKSPYRMELRNGDLNHLIDEQYAEAIASIGLRPNISEEAAEKLVGAIRNNVELRAPLFDPEVLQRIRFCITVKDVVSRRCYNVSVAPGAPEVWRTDEPDPQSVLEIETESSILLTSFASDWGGDAITIGYACEIYLREAATAEANIDNICVRLLTRHPSEREHLRRETVRGLTHTAMNPLFRAWLGNRLRGKRSSDNADKQANHVYDRSVWILRDKCDVCRICDLPLLNSQFAADL